MINDEELSSYDCSVAAPIAEHLKLYLCSFRRSGLRLSRNRLSVFVLKEIFTSGEPQLAGAHSINWPSWIAKSGEAQLKLCIQHDDSAPDCV